MMGTRAMCADDGGSRWCAAVCEGWLHYDDRHHHNSTNTNTTAPTPPPYMFRTGRAAYTQSALLYLFKSGFLPAPDKQPPTTHYTTNSTITTKPPVCNTF